MVQQSHQWASDQVAAARTSERRCMHHSEVNVLVDIMVEQLFEAVDPTALHQSEVNALVAIMVEQLFGAVDHRSQMLSVASMEGGEAPNHHPMQVQNTASAPPSAAPTASAGCPIPASPPPMPPPPPPVAAEVKELQRQKKKQKKNDARQKKVSIQNQYTVTLCFSSG